MQTTSETYKTLLAKGTNVTSKEVRATIGLDEYYQDQLVEVKSTSALVASDNLIGNCIASTLDIKIRNPNAIPRMAQIDIEVRLDDGETQSEWLPKGTYFIDTRAIEDDVLHIVAYDSMLKTEQTYKEVTAFTTWPQTCAAVVNEICTVVGVTLDARTSLNAYNVSYPNDYTMREVLGHIAAAHGGNWCVTDEGKLRLIPLTGAGGSTSLGTNVYSLDTSPALAAISKVTLWYGDEDAFTAGDNTGYAIEADCPWATQAIANGLLTALTGYVYRPFVARDALLDPAVELGDSATIDIVTYPLVSISTTFDALYTADIEAPQDEEVDHEYPFLTPTERAFKRVVKLGEKYYGTTITRENGLQIERTDGQTVDASVTLNADELTFRDGNGTPVMYFDVDKGTYIFNGTLGADAVYTDSLYAELGDVADLTVNRLDTGNYIARHLTGDISDMNHTRIAADSSNLPHIYLIASMVKRSYTAGEGQEWLHDSNGNPLYWTDEYMTETTTTQTAYAALIKVKQLQNWYGENIYWAQDISEATITNGYPYIDGVRVYTTTTNTGYPVMVWDYEDQIKADITFVLNTDNGYYEPRIILGAGDQYGTAKGYIFKGTSGLDIIYDRSGESGELALRLNDSGQIQKSVTANNTTISGEVNGVMVFENISVTGSDWVQESTPTFTNYPYAATLTCTGATSSMGGEVIFSPDDIESGNLAAAAQSGNGTVTIYATQPMTLTVLRIELRF